MKRKRIRLLSLLAAAVLLLSPAGCGAQKPEDTPMPSPEQSQTAEPSRSAEEPEAASVEPTGIPDSGNTPEPVDTPEPTAAPEPTPAPTAAPAPPPTPEPTQSGPEDGNYTAGVTLAGGTGRASVQSPAALRCTNGQFFAAIVWSSPNYDYMKVDGVRYDPVSAPGSNSAFEIPVAAFDQALPVIADTVAMSEPHEVEYTLIFDSSTLTKQ